MKNIFNSKYQIYLHNLRQCILEYEYSVIAIPDYSLVILITLIRYKI